MVHLMHMMFQAKEMIYNGRIKLNDALILERDSSEDFICSG
jgi:hypothetical protein